MNITERQEQILKAVVENYLEYGEPIGSKALVDMGFSLSSATIRSEMNELETLNLLEQPHTSAGRIPSHKGLRYYIDRLMHQEKLSREEQNAIDAVLYETVTGYDALLTSASQALANITELAAISISVGTEEVCVKRWELIPTGRRSALVVLITDNSLVRSKQCRMDVDLSPELLTVASNMINEKLSNLPLSAVTPAFMQQLAAGFGEFAFIFTGIFVAMVELLNELREADISFEGEMNLLINSGYEGRQLKDLMEFFKKRDILYQILQKQSKDISVVIGTEESKAHELSGSSMIVAKYKVNGREAGTIGLIGPTRINYKKMIPKLEYFAREIGNMITKSLENEENNGKE